MADESWSGFLQSLDNQFSKVGDKLGTDEWDSIHTALEDFKDVLRSLENASTRSDDARQAASDALFKVKNSLRDILNETVMVRFCRHRCLEIFESMEKMFEFQQMNIDEYLKKLSLESYGPLFKTVEEVCYAGELLHIPMHDVRTAFEPYMEHDAFSKFRKDILVNKELMDYIENNMEYELENMEALHSTSSTKIQTKMVSFIDDLNPILSKLAEEIEVHSDKMKTALIVGGVALAAAVGILALGGIGLGLLAGGIPGLVALISGGAIIAKSATVVTSVAGSLTAGAIGGYNIYKATKESKEVESLQSSHDIVTDWQETLRSQYLHWREIMSTFKDILHQLKTDREGYCRQQEDLNERLLRTKILLWEAVLQTGKFETQVEKLRDMDINI
ncbi:uncharacterized protein [Ptychodera flava]|uniref:uncharacterized protein n=1 Tax=Ptychodera flava TaxID=63121 RepID=UPI00396AA639